MHHSFFWATFAVLVVLPVVCHADESEDIQRLMNENKLLKDERVAFDAALAREKANVARLQETLSEERTKFSKQRSEIIETYEGKVAELIEQIQTLKGRVDEEMKVVRITNEQLSRAERLLKAAGLVMQHGNVLGTEDEKLFKLSLGAKTGIHDGFIYKVLHVKKENAGKGKVFRPTLLGHAKVVVVDDETSTLRMQDDATAAVGEVEVGDYLVVSPVAGPEGLPDVKAD